MTSPTGNDDEEGSRKAFQIPRLLRAAELLYGDGRILHGRIFLPVAGAHAGAVRVGEWLEGPSVFFPFLPDGEGRPLLLNKQQLLVLTMSPASDPVEAASATAPWRRVHIECGPLNFEGEVLIDMPAGRQRVLDLLNRPAKFLAVRGPERRYFVRKSAISRLSEPAGRAGA